MTRTLQAMKWPLDLPPKVEMDDQLRRVKGLLFWHKGAGYLSSLLIHLELVWDFDAPTAWCNSVQIGFNPYFFLRLPTESRVTLLGHEIYHDGFDHMSRLGNRCPDRWNQAADYVINLILKNAGFTFEEMDPLLDEQYADMSTEEVYDLLPKLGKPSNPDSLMPGEIGNDIKPVPDNFSKDKQIAKIITAKQASKLAGDEPGTIPGEVQIIIDSFLNPILPWPVILNRFFVALSKNDYSYRRPNRRVEEEYLPSLEGDNGLEHLIYYLDVSGSISASEILRFNSEVAHIHKQFRPEKLSLVMFDTEIRDIYEFGPEDHFKKIVITGRGGTSLSCVHSHILKNKPTAAIIFTDLCVAMMPNPRIPIVWVITGTKLTAPFGKVIHIPSEE